MPPRFHLEFLDLLVLAAYFAVSLYIGWSVSRRAQGAEQFLLAGRRLTLPLFVGSLVATWYGGILGVGGPGGGGMACQADGAPLRK